MKLKIELKLDGTTVSGRVLEQDEKFRCERYEEYIITDPIVKIKSGDYPQLACESFYIRGKDRAKDDMVFGYTYQRTERAEKIYKHIIDLVNELNGELGGVVDERGNTLYIDENGDALTKVNGISKDQKEHKGDMDIKDHIQRVMDFKLTKPIDLSKVEKDTLIEVSDDEITWYRRYFAKYKDGKVCVYSDGCTSKTATAMLPWKYARLAEED